VKIIEVRSATCKSCSGLSLRVRGQQTGNMSVYSEKITPENVVWSKQETHQKMR